jgi:hypothetical protein
VTTLVRSVIARDTAAAGAPVVIVAVNREVRAVARYGTVRPATAHGVVAGAGIGGRMGRWHSERQRQHHQRGWRRSEFFSFFGFIRRRSFYTVAMCLAV